MPKVYNRHHGDAPNDAVYIGRGTPWGNPYSHLDSPNSMKVESREKAIESFKWYVDRNARLRVRIVEELKGKDLVCSCKPAACHGDILLEIANGGS